MPGLKKFYEGCTTIPDFAKRACTAPGASFVTLVLESADPNGENKSIEDCVKLAKDVADAVTL
ncbi:MAG: acetyl-CoA synthase subunit delta, partial [Spirochaetaceae bacterium]|nr:acetyl-CoA synthase subunit delta [Spirochaetaceae bacterium]